MKFLTDQDVYAVTVRFLRNLGHDVVTATELALARAEDAELLQFAQERDRIVVTRDRDYGGLVFVHGSRAGVVYLRLSPTTQDFVHLELERVLTMYTEHQLRESFVVIEPGRHRKRKMTQSQDADDGES